MLFPFKANLTFTPAAATEYQVRVVITDSNGQAAVKKFDVNAVK